MEIMNFQRAVVYIPTVLRTSEVTKRRLSKFNGVKKNFELHLKESEWRYDKSLSVLQSGLWNVYKSYNIRLVGLV